MPRRAVAAFLLCLLAAGCFEKEDPVEKARRRDSVPSSEFYKIAKQIDLPKDPTYFPGDLSGGDSVMMYPPGMTPIVVAGLEFIAVNFRKVLALDMGLLDRKDYKVDSSGIIITPLKEALDGLCKPLEPEAEGKICSVTLLVDKKVPSRTALAIFFTAAASFGNKLYLTISPRQNEIGIVKIWPPRISSGLANIYEIPKVESKEPPPSMDGGKPR